jgi:hypothetical protein
MTLSPTELTASTRGSGDWLTPERLPAVRSFLLGLTLLVGLLIWVSFSLGVLPRGTHLVSKLRVIGVMTWVYALLQIVDLKIWHSRWAARRRAASRIPEAVEGWLFGQLIAWFGIAYYALTDDARWFIAGVGLFLISFAIFPIRSRKPDA